MDCASCAAHVRSALEAVDGVVSADVKVSAEKAVIEYDERRPDLRRLTQAVASAGYTVPAESLSSVPPDERLLEGRRFGRRAVAVTGLVFGAVLLGMVLGEWLGLFEALTRRVPLPIGVFLVALVGWPAFHSVVRAALRGRVISHTLMTVGVLAALAIGQWVTAAVVAFFMRVGDFVEGFTVRRGRQALKDLEALAPATARVERAGDLEEMPAGDVRVAEVVVVRPGERLPVDGEVVSGRASVEQAAITGESMPVEARLGTRVFAATIVRGGALRVRTTRVGAEATFGRIVRIVEDAEANRGRMQTFADRFSGWYLPVVAAVALLTFALRRDPLATAAVLVVACSCAFAIATPVAMLASIGASARRGLLVKGGAYLEALARADVVLVDKTGTFTLGRPTVAEVVSVNGAAPDEVLRLAASAERDSEHSLAEAVRVEASRRGLPTVTPVRFESLEAAGVVAEVEGHRVAVGSERLVSGATGTEQEVARLRGEGMSLAYVSRDWESIGIVAFRDEVRPEVPAAIAALRELGLERIALLTGDHERAAAPVAERLGIPFRAGLLPEDKIRIVREYQSRGTSSS